MLTLSGFLKCLICLHIEFGAVLLFIICLFLDRIHYDIYTKPQLSILLPPSLELKDYMSESHTYPMLQSSLNSHLIPDII